MSNDPHIQRFIQHTDVDGAIERIVREHLDDLDDVPAGHFDEMIRALQANTRDLLDQAQQQAAAAAADAAELQSLFDLQQTRMGEATARWRAEDPAARDHILPDLGSLLSWLMAQADTARNGRHS